MTKKHLLALGAVACSLTMLASCDKVESKLTDSQANQTILNVDGISANSLKEIYDALVTSGNTNSEKILNNILYIYSQSLYGSFIGKGDEKGLKDVVSTYLSTSQTTDLDAFINDHRALQVKTDGQVNLEASRVRATNIYKDILYRIYTTFLSYVTNSSYQERSLFNEDKFYDAQLKNYYTLGSEHFDSFVQVVGDKAISEENPGDVDGLNNSILNLYFKDLWGTYSDYIAINLLPDIYRNELTTEYMFTQNDAQINLTAARQVEYINLSSNSQYTDAVRKLMQQYSAQVIEKGLMDTYGFDFLSSLYKGTESEYNAVSPATEAGTLAKSIYSAANWTPATITVGTETIAYYKESSFGTICEKYATLLGQTSRDDSNWSSVYNDFTSSGSYSKETGFAVQRQSLIAEGHTTRGWYTSGGLSALPSSLNTRVFKAAVANEVDNKDLIEDTSLHSYKGGDGTYGRYIEGKYFLTPAAYSEANNYPYLVEDGTNYYIVLVKEATKSSKFSTSSSDFTYDSRATLEGERIARKVAYSLASIDTWKSDAKRYYVQQMAVMYHDDYVYEYFKSQFPDLFD
jgi:hypothetical protein